MSQRFGLGAPAAPALREGKMKWYGILAIAYGAFLLGFFLAALLRAAKS